MAKTSKASSSTTSKAREVASEGTDVRKRVRDLTVRAIRDRGLSAKELKNVAEDVLDGAVQGVRNSVPQAQRNVLRQVFEGLDEAVTVAAKAGAGAAREATARGQKLLKKDAHTAARRISDANEHMLDAAGTFAKRLSGELRDELKDLVARARRTAPKIKSAAADMVDAADGHLLELTGEAARAGTKAARRALGGLMMATGGLLEGLADSINPPKRAGGSGRGPAKGKSTPKRKVVSKSSARRSR